MPAPARRAATEQSIISCKRPGSATDGLTAMAHSLATLTNARSCNSSAHALRDNRAATQDNVLAAFTTLNLCAACYQRLALSYAVVRSFLITTALNRAVATSWQAAPNTWTQLQTHRRCAHRLTQTGTPLLAIESKLPIQRL
jgi:hypothetical protein